MKKPITDEKFYITDIPKDREKIKQLFILLGIEIKNKSLIDNFIIIKDNVFFYMYAPNEYGYDIPLSFPRKEHTVITYDDLMANYLPKDTILNEIVDEAIKEVSKNEDKPNKYKKQCKSVEIDVYDVLKAFNVVNPAIQHAIKKLLAGGQRGYKDVEQDYNEAIQSILRGIELENNYEN